MSHTHIEQGSYRGKHADGQDLNEPVGEAIKDRAVDDRISCSKASRIAKELNVSMEEVGRTADLLEIKVEQCLLGLFGYGRTKGKHRIMEPAESVSLGLEKAIRDSVKNGKLPCTSAWAIADSESVSKVAVCSAADALGIKASRCQLGAF